MDYLILIPVAVIIAVVISIIVTSKKTSKIKSGEGIEMVSPNQVEEPIKIDVPVKPIDTAVSDEEL